MRLLNADLAIVEREKITEYLLNPGIDTAEARRDSLPDLDLPSKLGTCSPAPCVSTRSVTEVSRTYETLWGPRFEINGELNAPDGRQPRIRTVWQVDGGQIAPRLITAYPLEAEE